MFPFQRDKCPAQIFNIRQTRATTAHGTETIGWLAMAAGQGSWDGYLYEAREKG